MAEPKVKRMFICGVFERIFGIRPGLRIIRMEVKRGM
jgi:hypothetical protein